MRKYVPALVVFVVFMTFVFLLRWFEESNTETYITVTHYTLVILFAWNSNRMIEWLKERLR